jgi:hypothetical protein
MGVRPNQFRACSSGLPMCGEGLKPSAAMTAVAEIRCLDRTLGAGVDYLPARR